MLDLDNFEKEQRKLCKYYPKILLTKEQFESLPAYDMTLPTDSVAGDMFKRNFYSQPWGSITRPSYITLIAKVFSTGADDDTLVIKWYLPKFRVKANYRRL